MVEKYSVFLYNKFINQIVININYKGKNIGERILFNTNKFYIYGNS